jgi:hypothetical protein
MLVYIFILIDFFNLKINLLEMRGYIHILTGIQILECIFLDVATISVCLFHN